MQLRTHNLRLVGKLATVALGMFAFGYALVPLYKAICEVTGINVLALTERDTPGAASRAAANTQIDYTRTITVEFDANARGPWDFKPAQRSIQVHPGELATVMYEFQNIQDRRMAAQAIPSYAPRQAASHFNKIERKSWPVAFVIDPKISKDVSTITLSYTFFEVSGGKTPQAAAPAQEPAGREQRT
jgi:cytochrome c oxidase assembly protein subunit 11